DPDGFGGLRLGPGAGAVLRGDVEVVMRRDRLRRRAALTGRGRGAAPTATVSAAAEDLFQELRALRAQIAKEQGVPPYVVFHDRTLREMVATMPAGRSELALVSGVGAAKLERYGERFLSVLSAARGSSGP